jgi:bifunctional DNase/RNase
MSMGKHPSVRTGCIIMQGPGGPQEVDARPSDAVNLAMASGAPIRLNSELFSAVPVSGDAEGPSSYPVAAAFVSW